MWFGLVITLISVLELEHLVYIRIWRKVLGLGVDNGTFLSPSATLTFICANISTAHEHALII